MAPDAPQHNTPDDIIQGDWLAKAFVSGGVDLQKLNKSLPREMATLADAPQNREPDDMSRVFAACSAQTGDVHFGLHMIDFAPLASMGIYGYLLLNAPTIGELLNIGEKYFSTFFLGATFEVTVGKHSCKLAFRRIGPETISPRHGNEWALGVMVRLIRSRLHPDWHPQRTFFGNEPPADLTELKALFGPKIVFRNGESSIEFSSTLLNHAIPDVDHNLLRILMAHGDELLKTSAPQRSFEARVRILIFENISQMTGGEEQIAKKMHMSVSSLKRRLSSHGLSYRALREEIIMDLACTALRDTDTRAGDIALGLGYSDGGAFSRAFSKAQGVPPLAYRKVWRNK